MIVITARNVNEALSLALNKLMAVGTIRSSRNGVVLAFPEPVTTVYLKPTDRVLFSPMRNANPAFHLLEALWMLAGRRDVQFPATLVKNMKSYTDDGVNFWGAYGHRWRNLFAWDQIDAAIDELKANPESRRVVVAMWNAVDGSTHTISGNLNHKADFLVGQRGGLDVPCNTHIYFDLRDGKLNMTVCCRSNDVLWGCYGANAVHMSVLQEYMALSIGVPVGVYNQMSNDLHVYTAKVPEAGLPALALDAAENDLYTRGFTPMSTVPLILEGETKEDFDDDIDTFFVNFDADGLDSAGGVQYETDFFNFTVRPMVRAWLYRKTTERAHREAELIRAPDWCWAMRQWLETNQKSFGGVK